ncbi:MAG: hypothetical protein Q7S16_02320 [bacterium]|nr:hypothetical protein [bacterium]
MQNIRIQGQDKSLAELMEGIDWKRVGRSVERGVTLNMEDLTILLHDIDRWRATKALGECLQKRGRRNSRKYTRDIARYKKGNIKRGNGEELNAEELRRLIGHCQGWIPNFKEEAKRGKRLITEARVALKSLIVEADRIRNDMDVGERYDPRVHGRPGSPD